MNEIDWTKENILYIANEIPAGSDSPSADNIRKTIEPWLTAIFQSEHLSLLIGTGLTSGICNIADVRATAMNRPQFNENVNSKIKETADTESVKFGRGEANFEDDIRIAIELLNALKIYPENDNLKHLQEDIDKALKTIIDDLLNNEKSFLSSDKKEHALSVLKRFLISFSSRTATRDRLHVFTTNYDRFIEYALDDAGIFTLDRFVGKLDPVMRMHKMELDYHYNPPGIRGEPRYVEGVVRYTKLHGSLDWEYCGDEIHKRAMPFGKDYSITKPLDNCVIYPNSAKGIETVYFPYSELFRDFSTAICRPNSVLVTYGYGFGDSHINRIILDMMTILSTHLVIISWDNASGRIQKFFEKCNPSQVTLLIGKHYGDIETLTNCYLPKSAIDKVSDRYRDIKQRRYPDSNNADESEVNPASTFDEQGDDF